MKDKKMLIDLIKSNDEKRADNFAAFINWVADNGWYRNGKGDEWYQIPKQDDNKTAKELYKIYSNRPKP